MRRIYRRSDRIIVKVDDVTIKLSPLSTHEKAEIQQVMLDGVKKSSLNDMSAGIALTLKYSIKDVSGLLDGDRKPYLVKLEGDYLSDESVEELMNIDLIGKLSLICASFAKGVPNLFTDNDGKPLEGVEILGVNEDETVKKNLAT